MITQFFTTFTGGFILPIAVLAIIVMAQVLQTTKSMDVCKIHTLLYAHGIASLLALLTSLLSIYYPDSIMVPLVMFASVIVIAKIQNDQGYIENMEGASGVLLYLSSVLSPGVIIVFALLLILFYFRFAVADEERSCLIIVQALSIAEALILALVNVVIPTTSVIGCLWTSTSCFIVFSLILPELNPKIAPIILSYLPTSLIAILNKEWL